MSTFTPTLPGGKNLAVQSATESVNRENYLTLYMQMVFNTYKATTKFQDLVTKQTLAPGAKSGTFFYTGIKEVKFLVRAEEAQGSALKSDSKVIELDDIMYCDTFVADIDAQMSVLDVVSENAKADGIALATELDYQVNIMINLASTQNSPVNEPGTNNPLPGGVEITLAAVGDESDANKLIAAFKLAAQTFDENNVPEAGRYLAIKPATFYTLQEADKLLNSDYSDSNGDYAQATLKGVAGLTIVRTNLLADFDPAVKWPGKYTGLQSKYNFDCSNTIALVFNKDAAAILMARSMKVEKGREYKAQGEFLMTTMFKGIGPLNPVGACSIKKAVV